MSARRRLTRVSLSLLPALLIVLFLGIGGAAATGLGAAQVDIEIGDNFFRERTVTVNVGDTVVWTHRGNRPHDVTSTDGGPLNSPRRMMNGATYTSTADRPGTYEYICTIHPGQEGTLVVQAAVGNQPSAAPRTGGGGMAGNDASPLPWLLSGLGLLAVAGAAGTIALRCRAA